MHRDASAPHFHMEINPVQAIAADALASIKSWESNKQKRHAQTTGGGEKSLNGF